MEVSAAKEVKLEPEDSKGQVKVELKSPKKEEGGEVKEEMDVKEEVQVCYLTVIFILLN